MQNSLFTKPMAVTITIRLLISYVYLKRGGQDELHQFWHRCCIPSGYKNYEKILLWHNF